ncbi:MAG: hypothetical protein ACLS6G_14090 [Christensenellales bacterium]
MRSGGMRRRIWMTGNLRRAAAVLRPSLSELSAADMESRRSLDLCRRHAGYAHQFRALAPKSSTSACARMSGLRRALPLEHTAGCGQRSACG